MNKKVDFLIALNSIKENFDINDINYYKELLDIYSRINYSKEADEDILSFFKEIVSSIVLKQLESKKCNCRWQEYFPNTSIDNLTSTDNFFNHSTTFQNLFKLDIFNPLNPDYNYTNILKFN